MTASNSMESLRTLVASAPTAPGVYSMLDGSNHVIYVGKASNLRKRLSSYLQPVSSLTAKTGKLMEQVRDIAVTVCDSPRQALILENNLIKANQPRYNILFRDDKSYPLIRLDKDHDYPGFFLARGVSKRGQRYFGPFTDSRSVRNTLSLLQKLFKIRNCSDIFFRNRSRPCLQYHLQRCSAPCTGEISAADYASDLRRAVLFLEGRGTELVSSLVSPMRTASEQQDYELAAHYRDLISEVRTVQQQYRIVRPGAQWDAVACCGAGENVCIQVFSVRDGVNLGNRSYMQRRGQGASDDLPSVLAAFLAKHYLTPEFEGSVVAEILLNHVPAGMQPLEEAISKHTGHGVRLRPGPVRGSRKRLLQSAVDNAWQYLRQRSLVAQHEDRTGQRSGLLHGLAAALKMTRLQTVECFDISHTGGTATTASCVVLDNSGPVRSRYRRFNIKDITAGDDYAAMAQAVRRHYQRQGSEDKLPQLLLIDGGQGQVRIVHEVLHELGCAGRIRVLGIAKAPTRKSGQEKLVDASGHSFRISDDPELWRPLLQLRDEAHRFALAGHRRRRNRTRSVLDDVPGVGPARRRLLLQHFGGLHGLRNASSVQLQAVSGIGPALAAEVYRQLHS